MADNDTNKQIQSEPEQSLGKTAAMTGALAAGVALAPAAIPAAIAVGLGVLVAPKILPVANQVASQTVTPALKTAVRTGHKAALTVKGLVEAASGKVQDLVGGKIQNILDWANTDEPVAAASSPAPRRKARQPRKS